MQHAPSNVPAAEKYAVPRRAFIGGPVDPELEPVEMQCMPDTQRRSIGHVAGGRIPVVGELDRGRTYNGNVGLVARRVRHFVIVVRARAVDV